MRICFVSKGTLQAFIENYGASDADVLFFGFNGVDGEVSYERELKGETDVFEEVALLSKECGAVVVCGCVTDTRGFKRKSAVVADHGKILGVSDMLSSIDGEYNPGAGLKAYDTSAGRLGVAVAEDIFFPELLRTLCVCGSEFVLAPFGALSGVEQILLRAAAFSYGAPFLLCGDGCSLIADVDGAVALCSPASPVEYSLEQKKCYHLVETRRRGFYRPERKDF